MKKTIVSLSILALGAFGASTAHAEDFSLHVEPGLAVAVGHPQDSTFRPGMIGSGKLLFKLVPNLSLGPSLSVIEFQRKLDNAGEADLWSFGATARFQGNRNGRLSPYLDVSGSVDKQASLYRPGLKATVGLEMPLDRAHNVWMGPFWGYSHTFDNTYRQVTDLLPHADVNAVTVGWSVSFDFPIKPVHTTTVLTKTVQVPGPVELRIIPVMMQQDASDPELVQVPATLSFDKDSAALNDDGKTWLDKAAQVMNRHPEASLDVEGHASSEGDLEHNWKLARERAQTVVNYLVSQGVSRDRLAPASFGPTGGNAAEELTGNRRVEFVVHTHAAK